MKMALTLGSQDMPPARPLHPESGMLPFVHRDCSRLNHVEGTSWETTPEFSPCLSEDFMKIRWGITRMARDPLHLSQDIVVARLKGDVEEFTHFGQLGTGLDQPLCEVSAQIHTLCIRLTAHSNICKGIDFSRVKTGQKEDSTRLSLFINEDFENVLQIDHEAAVGAGAW